MNSDKYSTALKFLLENQTIDSFGISQRSYNMYRSSKNNLHQNVKQMTHDELSEILNTRYWKSMKCDELPYPLDIVIFDTAINMGVGTTQRMFSRIFRGISINTLNISDLTSEFINARKEKHLLLAEHKPKCKKMIDEWMSQVSRLQDLKYD